jgi:protein-tyrosine phosphatase
VILPILAGLFTLVLSLAAYLWWQSSIQPAPYEELFEVREGDPLRVRRGREGWIIIPSDGIKPVRIRWGTSPEALGASLALTPVDGGYLASGGHHPEKRYFFEIDLEDGRTIQTAERVIPLEGAVNFRDLGGYETSDGKRLAWGKVYRSNELHRLTGNDLVLMHELGIKLWCDLRSYPEVEERPDRVPEGITYRHIPIYSKDPIGRLRVIFMRHRLDEVSKRLYRTSIIDEGAAALGGLLKLVADPANLPLVYHCTGGKDRTGVISALLLSICGVPEETIIRDYSLTNLSIEKFLSDIRAAFRGTRPPPGLKLEQFYPLLSARPELIEHAFAHIRTTYGSLQNYLRGPAGLSEAEMRAIRENLLA